MSSASSVTHWIGQLKAGDHAAAQKLWERYFQRLVRFARRKSPGASRRAADEEDVALSAFASFCRAAEAGRFPRLSDRDDLWQLLVLITERKAFDLAKYERRKKRGGAGVKDESAPGYLDNSSVAEGSTGKIVGREPTPDFAAQLEEEYRRLLAKLGDDRLRSVAVWKLEGYSNDEIAAKLGCVPRTVERKLRAIRGLWNREIVP